MVDPRRYIDPRDLGTVDLTWSTPGRAIGVDGDGALVLAGGARLALAVDTAGDEGALAAVLCLLLGTRASEVTDRRVRDVDDGGAILWIPPAKTEAGRRRLEVPEVVRAIRVAACHDDAGRRRPAAAPVFGGDREAPVDRHWLRYHVERLCRLAGVPSVSTQSLRRLHATLATSAGRTSHDVAAALGHTSPVVTQRHDTQPDATAGARQVNALRVLAGGRKGPTW